MKTSFYALEYNDTVIYYGEEWKVRTIYNDGYITLYDELNGEYTTVHYEELN